MLVDRAQISIAAGRGGDGVVSWRREKSVAFGGPDGGDGGRGGDIRLLASHNLMDLAGFRHRRSFAAEDGQRGANKKKHGRDGGDLTLTVPVGTEVTTTDGAVLADFALDQEGIVAVRGGRGGKGNWHFSDSTHRNPSSATKGGPGERKELIFQLKIVGDWAVVGLPNAGKSSLISALTGVELPIAPYSFSTREPFPVVLDPSRAHLILIDLPGLIEGAHLGRGLGDQFLKHTDRVKGLILVADASDQPEMAQETVLAELKLYRPGLPGLENKPRIVVLTKVDLISAADQRELVARFPEASLVSSLTGLGLDRLEGRLLGAN